MNVIGMDDENIKNFILLCILIFMIYFLFFKSNNKKNDSVLYDKIFMINLEKRKDRLNNFDNKYKNSDIKINYELFKAINGKQIDISKFISQTTYNELLQTERNKKRKYHYQLTRGAIGCYLSHINIWKTILDNNIEKAIIFEDDVVIPKNTNILLEKYTRSIPNDYDIILLGCNCIECDNKGNYKVVKKYWGMYAYIITKKCIDKIYNKMLPIKQQIDSELSDLSNEIKIYATKKNIIPHTNIGNSDIQIPLNNYTVESFKNYSE